MLKWIIVAILLLTGAAKGLMADAQFLPPSLSLIATPSSPSPDETVTVSAATPTFDRHTAFFEWTLNGAPAAELDGLGKNKITFTAGKVGSITKVSVDIRRLGGEGGRASVSIPVSDLTLAWSADTYVPKWYKGKALPVQNSEVRVVAVPHLVLDGERVDSKNLIYRWGLDDEKSVLSGVGEDVLRVRLSRYTNNSVRVSVAVEDIEKRTRKEGQIFIEPMEPKLLIYPYSPLGGIEPRNGAGFFFTPKRGLLDFIAEAFFLPVTSRRDLTYSWRVENRVVEGAPANPHILTIDAGARSGDVSVSASADDKDGLIPSVTKTMQIFLQ